MDVLNNKTITDIPGILACGMPIGLKKDNKKDFCIIYSTHKAVSAGVFTSNILKAAPVVVSMDHIKNSSTQAIVVNSGNANSCTGQNGIENSYKVAETAARFLNLTPKEVLVASTGILGTPLQMDIIIPGIEKACSSLRNGNGLDAASAILTTDKSPKSIVVQFDIEGKPVKIGGIAKGSTMIHPNMGTLLSFIVTDANIAKEMLQKALNKSVDNSYNMISIDGDTSTNDMVIALANGLSEHVLIDCENSNYNIFYEALDYVNIELSKMIAKDGEGSTKLVEVEVINSKSLDEARKCAKSVVSSNLVKCALYGKVADWPRVLMSLGYSGGSFNPDNIDIFLSNDIFNIQIVKNSFKTDFDNNLASNVISGDFIRIIIDLKDGNMSAKAWGCDLTPDYVNPNAYLNQQ